MDNMYQPPSGGPQDNWPTQEFGPAGGQQPAPSTPQRSGQYLPRYSRKLRWGAGLALAAVLAGGGALAATELTGSPGASAAQNSGQASALNTILSSAATPASGTIAGSAGGQASGPAAGLDAAALSGKGTPGAHPAAAACHRAVSGLRNAGRRHVARVVRRACRRGAVRRLAALRGLHGQFTVKTKSGVKTIGFTRGVVQSADSGSVIIKAADSTTWTWHLASTTVIREGGKKVSVSSLSAGEQVFAGGQIVSGADNARLVVIRPAHSGQGSSPAPSSGGSPSGTASGG